MSPAALVCTPRRGCATAITTACVRILMPLSRRLTTLAINGGGNQPRLVFGKRSRRGKAAGNGRLPVTKGVTASFVGTASTSGRTGFLGRWHSGPFLMDCSSVITAITRHAFGLITCFSVTLRTTCWTHWVRAVYVWLGLRSNADQMCPRQFSRKLTFSKSEVVGPLGRAANRCLALLASATPVFLPSSVATLGSTSRVSLYTREVL